MVACNDDDRYSEKRDGKKLSECRVDCVIPFYLGLAKPFYRFVIYLVSTTPPILAPIEAYTLCQNSTSDAAVLDQTPKPMVKEAFTAVGQ